ncbi:MAG TPA: hypothetical protein VKR52_02620 [Terracidiphilus sp.]|nr:hypothetical protein [Terracidiphilus sp.]
MPSLSDQDVNPRADHELELAARHLIRAACTVRNIHDQVICPALRSRLNRRKLQNMAQRSITIMLAFLVALHFVQPAGRAVEPRPAAVAGFDTYIARVEACLATQHQAPSAFIAPADFARLRRGELVIEQIAPPAGTSVPGAMLHHWRGTAFVPGASAADFDRLLRDFNAYPAHFAPQIVQSRVLAQNGNHYQIKMRVRQHHVITVVLDTTYDVSFAALDPKHHFSASRSREITEVDSPGTLGERELTAGQEHGFLWRLNSYWSYEERDRGLAIQIESVSLTRSIPTGMAWMIRPFVESIPRESLEFTLRSASDALRQQANQIRRTEP